VKIKSLSLLRLINESTKLQIVHPYVTQTKRQSIKLSEKTATTPTQATQAIFKKTLCFSSPNQKPLPLRTIYTLDKGL
jgi:hypothetical protein